MDMNGVNLVSEIEEKPAFLNAFSHTFFEKKCVNPMENAKKFGKSRRCSTIITFPNGIEKVVLNVNMDMIAHNDSLQLYASGLYHYPQLKKSLDSIKSPITLLYGHDDPNNKVLDDWTNSSDHRVFHNKGIPFIYFGVEDHKDYHMPTDTFETINQDFYVEAVKLIIQAIENYDLQL